MKNISYTICLLAALSTGCVSQEDVKKNTSAIEENASDIKNLKHADSVLRGEVEHLRQRDNRTSTILHGLRESIEENQ